MGAVAATGVILWLLLRDPSSEWDDIVRWIHELPESDSDDEAE